MTRMSKQSRIRAISPRKHKAPSVKTGPKKDALSVGYKEHVNAITAESAQSSFIPRIK